MKVIEFTRYRLAMILVSAVLIVAGIAGTILQGGFNLGIDFQAGINQRVAINTATVVPIDSVRRAVEAIAGAQVQVVGDAGANEFAVRVRDPGTDPAFAATVGAEVVRLLETNLGSTITELETTYVGPRFSQDLTQQSIWLTSLALALILAYLWFRFRLAYAVSSIVALVHDVVIMLGFLGTFQVEVGTATIAAVLNIVGDSLNDTIVIFDRVRENGGLMREAAFPTVVNASISQSLSRTVMTSVTTLLAVLAIFVFAVGSIKDFALALIVGVIVGTYSSVFIASPVLIAWTAKSAGAKKAKALPKRAPGSPDATAAGGKRPEPQAVGTDSDTLREQILQQKRAGAKTARARARRSK